MANIRPKPHRKLRVEIRKNLTQISYFVCDNGLGHITRSVEISKALAKYYKIYLYSDITKLRKFSFISKIKKKEFKFNTDINDIDINLINKIKKLNLKKNELVISDNYPDFCIIKNPLIIVANFFWHEIFNINNINTKYILKNLIERKVPIFGNYIFQTIQNKKLNIKKTGFIGKFKGNLKSHKNILVSLGTAKINKKIEEKLIFQISKELERKNNHVKYYFDEIYFSKFKKYENVFFADYTEKMFRKISICIGKPGMGTINDCLKYGIVFITLNLKFNKEFQINSQIIKKNKLGLIAQNFKSAVVKADYIFKNKIIFKKYFKLFSSLKWSGELEILNFIKKNY